MPALQIRDLPDNLYDGLKLRAMRKHRSLAQEATVAIERHLMVIEGGYSGQYSGGNRDRSIYSMSDDEGREERIAKRKAIFAEIASMPKVEIPEDFPSIVELVHMGRDENDARLGL